MSNDHSDITGDFTDESAFDLGKAQSESLSWIEAVLNENFTTSQSFREKLRDGKKLCRFINCIVPNSVPRINKLTVAYACMENITHFLNSCRQIGLKDTQLFVSTDLYGGHELTGKDEDALKKDLERQERDVCITIYWLGRAVRELPDYHGPQLNLAAFITMKCTRCSVNIESDDFVVDGALNFHRNCYFCNTCDRVDVDSSLEHHWDRDAKTLACNKCLCVGCKKHLEKGGFQALSDGPLSESLKICPDCNKANVCATCGLPCDPNSPDVLEQNGSAYCPDCYCHDEECKKPLPTDDTGTKECIVDPKDGLPYCYDCACGTCHKKLDPNESNLKDPASRRKYCPDCYCHDEDCKKPLPVNEAGEKICIIDPADNMPYCLDCACSTCSKKLDPGQENIKDQESGKKYCPACYCHDQDCKKPLQVDQNGQKICIIDPETNNPYCPECACSTCKKCAGPDAIVVAEDAPESQIKKYCPDCHCHDEECRKPLPVSEAGEKICIIDPADNKPYCLDCACVTCKKHVIPGPDTLVSPESGKKYCQDCHCYDKACRKPFNLDKNGKRIRKIAKSDGKPYCPDCICSDPSCGKLLCKDDYINVPPCPEFPEGAKVCKSCGCGLCHSFIPKSALFQRRKGIKYCTKCTCLSCKLPLTHLPQDAPRDAAGRAFCTNCKCASCQKQLPRKSSDIKLVSGSKYCATCVCRICGEVIEDKAAAIDGACSYCLCATCKAPTPPDARRAFGRKFHCANCICAICNRPSTKLRGALIRVQDKSYCKDCICKTCASPLVDGRISYGDYDYCVNCACADCRSPLAKRDKVVIDGTTYCYDCICVQCNSKLSPETTVIAFRTKACTNCACFRCGRPESNPRKGRAAEKPYQVSQDGKKYCSDCRCRVCHNFLTREEDAYCSQCSCQACGSVLDEDEEIFCSECGEGQEGFLSKKDKRKAKKALVRSAA